MPTIDPNTTPGIQPNIPGASGYTLTMSDEFNSSTLDSKWQIFNDFGDSSPVFNWDVNNGGNGKFRVWPDASNNYNDFTMRSTGSNPFTQVYGVWECRVKLCRGRGIFPSIWAYKHPDAQPQAEIDIFEAYGYDGGGWNNGSSDGWRPRNSAWTIWRDGGGNTIQQSGTLKLSDKNDWPSLGAWNFPDLSAQFDTYTLLWEPSGLTFYYNGVQWGSKTGAIWTPTEINGPYGPCAVVVDLWFSSATNSRAGLPIPTASTCPSGPSNSMEIDYIRVWSLPGSGGGGGGSSSFSAELVVAPASSATISGIVNFQVQGETLRNVELIDSASDTPVYGIFTINSAFTAASLNLDTKSLTNGPKDMRIRAWAVPPGSVGSSTIVMSSRRFYISNISSSDIPIQTVFDITF